MIHHKVLIVEDEVNLGVGLKKFLIEKNFDVFHALNCQEARSFLAHKNLEDFVILLDVNLPDGNGLDFFQELTQQSDALSKGPMVLFLSAQNDPDTKFKALSEGGLDFITKPFDLRELLLRLQRLLGKGPSQSTLPSSNVPSTQMQLGDLYIDLEAFTITGPKNNEFQLLTKECKLLKLLIEKSGKALSREEILDKVWGEEKYPSNRTVDNYIVRLRRYFETSQTKEWEIQSIRGIGYKLTRSKNDI